MSCKQLNSFDINQSIDLFTNDCWITAKVVGIGNTYIQITHVCNWSYQTIFVHINSNRIAPLYSHTIKYQSLAEFHHKSIGGIKPSHPIYYQYKNKKYILLSTSTSSSSQVKGLYLYNIDKNEWKLLTKYPKQAILLNRHNQALDAENNKLYLFGGHQNSLGIFDLNTNEWDIKVGQNNKEDAEKYVTKDLLDVNCIYLPSPINALHLTTGNCHVIYDENKKKFIDVAVIDDIQNHVIKMVYYQYNTELFVFNKTNRKIYFCEVNKKEYQWNEYDLQLPYDTNTNQSSERFEVILMLQHVAVIIYEYDIYILDLKYTKLYKSEKAAPRARRHEFWVSCNNMIHTISGWSYYTHFRFSLNDIIPNEMKNYYAKNVKNALTVGYIKEFEKKYSLFHSIPIYLSFEIDTFYFIFFDH